MAQILDPLPSNSAGRILCCYVNATSQIQIVRISNVLNWYFERVVFPGQRLVFESLPEALLEIHTGMMASAILSDKIPCSRLQINHGPFSSIDPHQSAIRDNAASAVEVEASQERVPLQMKPKVVPEPLTIAALTSVD